MSNALQLMAGGFSGGGRGDSGNSQEDDYYRAQLQEYLWRLKVQKEMEDRAYAEKNAQYLAQTLPGAMDSAMQNAHDVTPDQQASFNVLKNAARLGSPALTNSLATMLEQAQRGLVQAGVPTDMMKERFQSARDPGLEEYSLRQRQQDPAQIQVARRITELQQSDPQQSEILSQIANPRNPDNQADITAAKESAKLDTRAATEGIVNAPKTLAAYDELAGQADTMLDHIGKMKDLMMKNPNVVGWGSYLGYLPETDQKAFSNLRQTLVSGLALENLQKLKSISPTGASGFGALSEGELRVLQDSIAKLDQAADPQTVNTMLGVIQEKLQKVKDAAVRSYADDAQWFRSNRDLAPRSYRTPLDPQNIGDIYNRNKGTVSGTGGWRVVR